jgi:hypothetical protein
MTVDMLAFTPFSSLAGGVLIDVAGQRDPSLMLVMVAALYTESVCILRCRVHGAHTKPS